MGFSFTLNVSLLLFPFMLCSQNMEVKQLIRVPDYPSHKLDTFAYISVLDVNRKPIAGVTVISAGKPAEKHKEHAIYAVHRLSPYALWDIMITAKGFDTVRYKAPFLEYSDFFLLKKNDKYYYSKGRRVPIYQPNNMIFVYTVPLNKKNEMTPDPDLIKKQLVKVLDSLGLMIAKNYFTPLMRKAFGYEGYHPGILQPTNDVYKAMCMFAVWRKDKIPISSVNSKELQGLRNSSLVWYAGPLFTHDPVNWSDPQTYNGKILLNFACNEERTKEILAEFKLSVVSKIRDYLYMVKVPDGDGYSENDILEKLSLLKKDIAHIGVNGEEPGSMIIPLVEPKDSLAFGDCKRYGYMLGKYDQGYSLHGMLQVTNTTWHNVYIADADPDQAYTTVDLTYWEGCKIPLRPGKSTFITYRTLILQNHYDNDLHKFFTDTLNLEKRSIGVRVKGCGNKSEEHRLTFRPNDLCGSDTLSFSKKELDKCTFPEGQDLQMTFTDSFDIITVRMSDGSLFLSGFIKLLNISNKTLHFIKAESGADSVTVTSPYSNCILKPGKALIIQFKMKKLGQVEYCSFPLKLTFSDHNLIQRTFTLYPSFNSNNLIFVNKSE